MQVAKQVDRLLGILASAAAVILGVRELGQFVQRPGKPFAQRCTLRLGREHGVEQLPGRLQPVGGHQRTGGRRTSQTSRRRQPIRSLGVTGGVTGECRSIRL